MPKWYKRLKFLDSNSDKIRSYLVIITVCRVIIARGALPINTSYH